MTTPNVEVKVEPEPQATVPAVVVIEQPPTDQALQAAETAGRQSALLESQSAELMQLRERAERAESLASMEAAERERLAGRVRELETPPIVVVAEPDENEEAELPAVIPVTVPPSAVEDAPAKTPAHPRHPLLVLFLGRRPEK